MFDIEYVEAASQDNGGNPMKVVTVQDAKMDQCIKDARRDHLVITRNGRPVAMVVPLKGMDLEQVELGLSDKFWRLIRSRRAQKTISRAELERRLEERDNERDKKKLKKRSLAVTK
jgi:prevent-host-death family protein